MTDIITNEDRHIRQFQRLALSLVPPLERCHRNLCNEVNYVVTTLNLISLQHFDFKLSRQAAILALYDCGYIFFKRRGNWRGTIENGDPDERPLPPNLYVYLNMNGDLVRSLRLLTIPVPPNTSADKLAKLENMRTALSAFVEKKKWMPRCRWHPFFCISADCESIIVPCIWSWLMESHRFAAASSATFGRESITCKAWRSENLRR